MPRKSTVRRTIKFAKNKFNLEIYLGLEKDLAWEIFPHDYSAALYAFSNKDTLNKTIETNHLYEKRKK